MNAFEKRHAAIFEFGDCIGWDGHSAQPISPQVKANAEYVWDYYNLQSKPYDLILMSNGAVVFEVKCIHGLLEIFVYPDEFTACITDRFNKVVMPDIVRKF